MHKSAKYTTIFNELLARIRTRTGQTPDEVGTRNKELVEEGMSRESACQVLATEPLWIRIRFLFAHPSLIVPYLIRVRKKRA